MLMILCLPIAPLPCGAQGSLVIIGGGLRPQTSEIWRKIVELAGGRGARIAVFGSASEAPQESAREAIRSLNAQGAHALFVPVALKLAGTNAAQAARDPANVRLVLHASGVFFCGGDQGRITQALRDAQGAPTPVLRAIWRLYDRGGVVAGTSAGAAVMSKTMFFEPRETLELLRLGPVGGQDLAPGLGFLEAGIVIDQHALVRARFARLLSAMAVTGDSVGLGIDEDTAAIVMPGRPTELIGRSGAVLIHRTPLTRVSSVAPLQVEDALLSLLAAGDSLDLQTGQSFPSADKLSGALAAGAAGTSPIPASSAQADDSGRPPDALENGSLLKLAILAATGPGGASVGQMSLSNSANAGQGTFKVGLAFRPDSRAYFVQGLPLGGYSIVNLHLDIEPIGMSDFSSSAQDNAHRQEVAHGSSRK